MPTTAELFESAPALAAADRDAGAHAAFTLSIVVPLRDEEANVRPLVDGVRAAMAAVPWPWQLILVDDGSRDATRARIREAVAAGAGPVSALFLRRPFGQTAAMQAGIDAAVGSIIATMDGDLQHDPRDIPRMVRRLVDDDLDLLVGWRRARRDGFWRRRLPSLVANRLIAAATGVCLHDAGCSLKICRAQVLRAVRLYGDMHRFIPGWMATLTAPERIGEEVVSHFPRVHGHSKYGLSRTFRVLLDLLAMAFFLRFRDRPGHFFGRIGLVCWLAGTAALGWLGWQKLADGASIAARPLLMLGLLLVLTGVQFVCTGMLTEMLARTWFEAGGACSYHVREILDGAAPRETP